MTSRYEIIIFWSDEDQAFVAEVPELPGCMADGSTYHEALANAETVIDEWIQTASELGRAIPEPRGRLAYDSRGVRPARRSVYISMTDLKWDFRFVTVGDYLRHRVAHSSCIVSYPKIPRIAARLAAVTRSASG